MWGLVQFLLMTANNLLPQGYHLAPASPRIPYLSIGVAPTYEMILLWVLPLNYDSVYIYYTLWMAWSSDILVLFRN